MNRNPLKTTFLALFCSASLGFCSHPKAVVSTVETSTIPELAVEVRIYSDMDPDEYYSLVRKSLELMDIKMFSNQALDRELQTEPVSIGRGLDLVIDVETYFDASYMKTASAFVGQIRTGWETGREGVDSRYAYWSAEDDIASYAFIQLIEIARKIDHAEMTFAVAQQSRSQP